MQDLWRELYIWLLRAPNTYQSFSRLRLRHWRHTSWIYMYMYVTSMSPARFCKSFQVAEILCNSPSCSLKLFGVLGLDWTGNNAAWYGYVLVHCTFESEHYIPLYCVHLEWKPQTLAYSNPPMQVQRTSSVHFSPNFILVCPLESRCCKCVHW